MNRIQLFVFVLLGFSNIGTSQINHPEIQFVKSQIQKTSDLDIYVTDHYTSKGITHTYFKDAIDGIPIYNSRGAVHHINGSNVVTQHNLLSERPVNIASQPVVNLQQAIVTVANEAYDKSNVLLDVLITAEGAQQKQTIRAASLSLSPISGKLQYLITDNGNVRLVWEFAIEDVDTGWFMDYFVDAISGKILRTESWTVSCNHGLHENHSDDCTHHITNHTSHKSATAMMANTYEVYNWPVESPNYGNRTMVAEPWNDNLVASPNGWHVIGTDTSTHTVGNNTDTYLDSNNTNSPSGGDNDRADGGEDFEFIFPLDVNGNPVDYQDAAITNTFYWTNLMHDVWYNYGFDEASGNFQQENYTPNGNGSDYVRSEVQDGSGSCNANFGTPPDGNRPRMQMYLCNGRDGDYDNGVIAHEFGHGISNRLTGGPGSSGCLGNREQMGEGWSDYFGLVMTIESGDTQDDARPIGTWLFNQGPNGGGIRPYPYSVDRDVNPMTYDFVSRSNISQPHGIGSVWCTMIWDLTWALIAEEGWDSDIYNGNGGNNTAMNLVMEGLKLQPCSPGFVDGRDAIIEADILLNNGENEALIWETFAARGLGASADQGSSNNRSDGKEAFDRPTRIVKTADVSEAKAGDAIEYTILIENNYQSYDILGFVLEDELPDDLTFVSASDGGIESGGIITFPAFDISAGEYKSVTIIAEVNNNVDPDIEDFLDDVENGASNWNTANEGATNWSIVSTAANSGTNSWFAPDNNSIGIATLDIAIPLGLRDDSELAFMHSYDTQAGFDGGRVLISIDGGFNFIDLGDDIIMNGYNNNVYSNSQLKSVPGFSGNSNGFVSTVIDISEYTTENVILRFQMDTNGSTGGVGWWIDDISVNNLGLNIINFAEGSAGIVNARGKSTPVLVNRNSDDLRATISFDWVKCSNDTDGNISVTPLGGSGTYTYIWNDGSTDGSRSGLASGVYSVTVSDGIDQVIKSGIIGNPSPLQINLEATLVTNSDLNNGTATVIVGGGAKDYGYSWNTGATSQTITGLTPSTYTVTVTDFGGCTATGSIDVPKYGCGDKFYDSGGSNGNYFNQEDIVTTICPDNFDEAIAVDFLSFNVESNWDALYIYNGKDINAPLFSSGNAATLAGYPAGGYYGTSNPGSFVSTDESGCITFRFRSDQYVTRSGWNVDITCTDLCSDTISNTNDDFWGSIRRTLECATGGDIIPVSQSLNLNTVTLLTPITIDKEVSVEMPSGNILNIGIDGSGPIFDITATGTFTLNNINLLSGEASTGGAVSNSGTLILNNVSIHENENTSNPSSLIDNTGEVRVIGNTSIKKD